ncbi:SDR family oxidoreductase [Bacillus fonticola]|uniref:SDR family oxidoreductase n=1 Tax=Bacillus fonticola TaxID=2728853 RepID=UPI001472BDCE|nr:SDR family oxidoreductase [Bacillus fonticola]
MKRKYAFLTGGTKGIGHQIATRLAKDGFDLFVNYRSDESQARRWAKSLEETEQCRIQLLYGDITKKEDCLHITEQILMKTDVLHACIHNAGPFVRDRMLFADYDEEKWDELFKGNVYALLWLTKPLMPLLREASYGRVVTFGFDEVEHAPGWAYRSAFAAAKTATASLTKSIAKEEATNGITAHMVCPGDIVPPWKEATREEALLVQDDLTPVGRPGTGEDVARVVSFLCQEDSDFLTGNVIHVGGGAEVLHKHSVK